MLVNIYGSKDLFVSEYRTLLADRILSSFNYDTEKEVAINNIYLYLFQCYQHEDNHNLFIHCLSKELYKVLTINLESQLGTVTLYTIFAVCMGYTFWRLICLLGQFVFNLSLLLA